MANRDWPGDGGPLSGPPSWSMDDPQRSHGWSVEDPQRPHGWPVDDSQRSHGMPPSHVVQPPPGEQSSLVRPYAMTGGRTAPRIQLAMEALVSSATSAHHDLSNRTPEYQAISALCRQVRSVAEISAMLRISLGVTRILVADMAAEGLVQLHQPQLDAGKPDLNLLERVLSGLRRL
ncbi:DUF742 domain-containing protein [Streptosporangium sandarakinum]|uniref:DUF742 domain-containing protein n=1 Tax=Streptosporangium sandarakinum TaxID=1260955 RepID=A0A852UW49_9ACTN|nr:hypothetical protein [Streptosporangium sandarakinum]